MFQTVTGVPIMPIVGIMLGVAVVAALGVFFKPLLAGLVKAAVLVVRPRLSREEQAARRQLRDIKLMKKMINSAHGVTQTAELHSFASRG
ncbi:MAG: hypothetical protein JWP59_3818 [Massilia sp.]|jgi:hypothetical protein|nr:hypothetical protein [Massilia sp.]